MKSIMLSIFIAGLSASAQGAVIPSEAPKIIRGIQTVIYSFSKTSQFKANEFERPQDFAVIKDAQLIEKDMTQNCRDIRSDYYNAPVFAFIGEKCPILFHSKQMSAEPWSGWSSYFKLKYVVKNLNLQKKLGFKSLEISSDRSQKIGEGILYQVESVNNEKYELILNTPYLAEDLNPTASQHGARKKELIFKTSNREFSIFEVFDYDALNTNLNVGCKPNCPPVLTAFIDGKAVSQAEYIKTVDALGLMRRKPLNSSDRQIVTLIFPMHTMKHGLPGTELLFGDYIEKALPPNYAIPYGEFYTYVQENDLGFSVP